MVTIEEILALVRAVNSDEFNEPPSTGNSLDDLYQEVLFLTSRIENRRQRTQSVIDHISDCFAGNFFKELPISDAMDELDVISMGFNTYMEELESTMVSKQELTEANEKLKEEKERSEQLSAAKDEFMSNMSHEIRTPLNGILGFVNILLNDGGVPPEYRKQLEYAKTSGDILLVIINDILDLAKIDAGKMMLEERPVNLIELSQLMHNTFLTKITEKELEFNLVIEENLPNPVLGDSVRLSQILFNFVSNSIKFTPAKGKVELRIALKRTEKDRYIVELSVTDTGIGIPKDKIQDIFVPFVQTSNDTARKYGGTGLGLTIVKKIIQLMNGEVTVESELGKGTRFSAVIPFRIPEDAQLTDVTPLLIDDNGTYSLPDRPIRVLLAEDNAINQLIVQTVLQKREMEVFTVETGKQAVEAVQNDDFDIILMDIMMPEMDGYEATQAIRKLPEGMKCSIPIVALTAVVTNEVTTKCRNVGMDDYLSKPFDPKDLYQKIIATIHRRLEKLHK